MGRLKRYIAPSDVAEKSLISLVAASGRGKLDDRQLDMLRAGNASTQKADVRVFCAGDLNLLHTTAVSIVGTREVSEPGRLRASRLARELAALGVTVVSGLAKGVDTAALLSAAENGGRLIAVIGTPLSTPYPAENAQMQEDIWRNHLLVSPFAEGERVFRSNFPKRNRVMAALSDATVIVEASDTSGTLHQAAECQRLGRWLFIMKSVAEDPNLKWPSSFLGKPKTAILKGTDELMQALSE